MRRLTPIALALSISLPHCTSSSTAPTRPAAVAAAAHSAPGVAVPLDPDVRHGVLPNGLTYYIRANHKPEKRAELRLAVNAGSVLETDEQRGLAHFVEHMAFNGTKRYPKQELVDYLERIGMRFGPDVNAYTSFDETVYMLQVPTDDPKIVDTAFDILHEWAGSVTFQPDRIQKERGVITEEWRLGRGAGARIRDRAGGRGIPSVFVNGHGGATTPFRFSRRAARPPRSLLSGLSRHAGIPISPCFSRQRSCVLRQNRVQVRHAARCAFRGAAAARDDA